MSHIDNDVAVGQGYICTQTHTQTDGQTRARERAHTHSHTRSASGVWKGIEGKRVPSSGSSELARDTGRTKRR